MQLNLLYYVEFSDIYRLRITALRQERGFVLQRSTEKDFEKNYLDFNHFSLSPFHPQKTKRRFTGDPKLTGPLLGGQPLKFYQQKHKETRYFHYMVYYTLIYTVSACTTQYCILL